MPGDPRVPALPQGRRVRRAATPATTPTSPATATRACASTCAARGDSDGIIEDEYLPQEQEDAIDVIAWLAEQPWCTGAVGMLGISWGGFNGLQVAARRPPALKAVISMCASDDRYADDVHYVGGCVLAVDMLPWAATMLTGNALPPDQAVGGRRLARRRGCERIERTPPFIEAWLAHQRRDDYWRQGSVCEDYEAIDVPVYAIGGWADGYTNAIPRLIEGLPGPRKGLIGPWSHAFPQDGAPGPAIGFLQECLRWFDQHLKGIDTGIMDEPRLRVWMQEPVAPATHHTQRPGRWVSEPVVAAAAGRRTWTWDFSPERADLAPQHRVDRHRRRRVVRRRRRGRLARRPARRGRALAEPSPRSRSTSRSRSSASPR